MLKLNKDKHYYFNIWLTKWFWMIFYTLLLSLGVYFFTFGFQLVTGGLDGLTVLTIEILQNCGLPNDYIPRVEYLYGFYNIISLIAGYKVFGKDFCYHTGILCIILCLSVSFLSWLFGDISIVTCYLSPNDYFNLIFVSIASGILFGIALGNIRKYKYTTGGMDIFQKILKDIYGINFIWVVFITDGVLILLTAIIIATKNHDLMQFIIRFFCSYLSSFIMSCIIEKIAPEIQSVK
ncbi:YitT family protein [Candidatus Phytoplasma phoenicium]|nr:YitT family protein [Candidatus Phytoplasma phoenicium]